MCLVPELTYAVSAGASGATSVASTSFSSSIKLGYLYEGIIPNKAPCRNRGEWGLNHLLLDGGGLGVRTGELNRPHERDMVLLAVAQLDLHDVERAEGCAVMDVLDGCDLLDDLERVEADAASRFPIFADDVVVLADDEVRRHHAILRVGLEDVLDLCGCIAQNGIRGDKITRSDRFRDLPPRHRRSEAEESDELTHGLSPC